MVNKNLRKRIIERAIKKLAVKPLSILEADSLQEYIEELEAAQQSVQSDGAGVCPLCGDKLFCAMCGEHVCL